MELPNQFHAVAPVADAAKSNEGLVKLVGDGTALLRVPKLKKLNRVFIGDVELPLKLKETYIQPGGKSVDVTLDMVKIERPSNGGDAFLLRNIKSNNGIWQEGQAIYIDGEFEKEPSAPAKPATPAK